MTKRLTRHIAVIATLALLCSLAGCSNWERNTFDTLSGAKSVIDQAANDYNAGKLPKTQQTHDVIEKAQQVKDAAVLAFKAYWDEKSAVQQAQASGQLDSKGASARMQLAVNSVNTALQDLPPLISAIQKLH